MDKSQASFEILLSLVHGANPHMSPSEVERYTDLAIELAESLHKKLKEDEE
jgi:hypothetical protein